MENFVHLHQHSDRSTLDGMSKLPDLVQHIKSIGQSAMALTDHGTMMGTIEAYNACKKAGIKFTPGVEIYVTDADSHLIHTKETRTYHLTLLAENETGYYNLMQLTTLGYLEGFYRKPRVSHELLEKFSEGVICLSGCIAGELSRFLQDEEWEKAEALTEWYMSVYDDRFYLEMMDHGIPEESKSNDGILRLHYKYGVPVVATNDAHYIKAQNSHAHDVLLCVQTQSRLSNPTFAINTDQLYVKTAEEMAAIFGHIDGALSNTVAIADRCNVEIKGESSLPDPILPPQVRDPFEYLKRLTWDGMKERYGLRHKEAIERAKFELEVIETGGYVNYLHLVRNFINYARDRNITVGVRGSVSGSLVAFCLGISTVDPLRFGLSFERFLNPERVSMPDVDIDIEDQEREGLFQYVKEQFGEDHVARILTSNTMAAKMTIRDVGRAMELDEGTVAQLSSMIPFKDNDQTDYTLEKALERIPEFRKFYNEDKQVHEAIDIALQLEGVGRSIGIHPAGVVIADRPLHELVPLYKGSSSGKNANVIATQYMMNDLEQLGLLKMDFLGLRTLTVLKQAAGKIGLTVDTIPLDDPKTFELLSTGETFGIFQIESSGMKQLMKSDKPKSLEEVAVLVALYRPGPMQFLENYVNRHHGEEGVNYPHPAVEAALQETFGIPVYQEQIMRFVSAVAGFSPGKADLVRKAMGKKIHKLMQDTKKEFIQGAVNNGITETMAGKLWNIVAPHAGYSFNKSHAIAYGAISVKTAYLKANYPTVFMWSYLSAERGNLEKVTAAIGECRRLNIDILPPSINESDGDFLLDDNKIRYGISALKGVGDAVGYKIVEERENGRYKSIGDFCKRHNSKIANKRVLEALIKSGAFDEFGEDRNVLLKEENLERMISYVKDTTKQKRSGQISLFGDDIINDLHFVAGRKATRKQKLAWEKEITGTYLSENLLRTVQQFIDENELSTLDQIELGTESITVAGIIVSSRVIRDRNHQPMAFLKLQDNTDSIEVVVFASVYNHCYGILKEDELVSISGKLQERGGSLNILAQIVRPVVVEQEPTGGLDWSMTAIMKPSGDRHEDNGRWMDIKRITEMHPGNDKFKLLANGRSIHETLVKSDSRLSEALEELGLEVQIG